MSRRRGGRLEECLQPDGLRRLALAHLARCERLEQASPAENAALCGMGRETPSPGGNSSPMMILGWEDSCRATSFVPGRPGRRPPSACPSSGPARDGEPPPPAQGCGVVVEQNEKPASPVRDGRRVGARVIHGPRRPRDGELPSIANRSVPPPAGRPAARRRWPSRGACRRPPCRPACAGWPRHPGPSPLRRPSGAGDGSRSQSDRGRPWPRPDRRLGRPVARRRGRRAASRRSPRVSPAVRSRTAPWSRRRGARRPTSPRWRSVPPTAFGGRATSGVPR